MVGTSNESDPEIPIEQPFFIGLKTTSGRGGIVPGTAPVGFGAAPCAEGPAERAQWQTLGSKRPEICCGFSKQKTKEFSPRLMY